MTENLESQNFDSLKKTSELLSNWYQSYYAWNLAYLNSSVLASNANLLLLNCNHSNYHQSQAATGAAIPQDDRNSENTHFLDRLTIVPPHLVNYKIPSLTRRFLAELFDAIYIQFVKITIALLLLNYTDLINEDSFRIFDLFEDFLNEDNITNIRLPFELLLLEIFYVATSIVFESLCLHKRSYTPGKYLFGLRVVYCLNVNDEANDIVRIIPGNKLPFKSIMLRTCLKNFSVIFLFPTIIFFILPAFGDHGQTSYDKISDSIVVQIA